MSNHSSHYNQIELPICCKNYVIDDEPQKGRFQQGEPLGSSCIVILNKKKNLEGYYKVM